MSDNRLFIPYFGVLRVAIACQVVLPANLRRANREGHLLPGWLWRASATFDFAMAAALPAIAVFLSPRGAMPALSAPSAPPLLLMPLVVLLSDMRLRPHFTLYAELAGGSCDGTPQSDDMTAIVVKRTAAAAVHASAR